MPLLSVVCCCKSIEVYFIHNSFRKHGSITCRRGAVGWWHLNHISHFACLPLKSQFTGNCVSRKVNAKFALKKSQHSYEKFYVIFTPHNFFYVKSLQFHFKLHVNSSIAYHENIHVPHKAKLALYNMVDRIWK